MNIIKEHALSDRSTCRWCHDKIPLHAPRARIGRGAEPGKTRVIYDMLCKECACKKILMEIRSMERELTEMEAYK
jgi:hypothetical protein